MELWRCFFFFSIRGRRQVSSSSGVHGGFVDGLFNKSRVMLLQESGNRTRKVDQLFPVEMQCRLSSLIPVEKSILDESSLGGVFWVLELEVLLRSSLCSSDGLGSICIHLNRLSILGRRTIYGIKVTHSGLQGAGHCASLEESSHDGVVWNDRRLEI